MELVVVIAIFIIITAVVLANAPQFRENANLDLISQEVSLHIRGAQVYGLGTRFVEGSDYDAFGVHFSTAEETDGGPLANKYQFYLYGSIGGGVGLEANLVESYRLSGGSFEIFELSVDGNPVNQLSILFQRPETKAKFFHSGSNSECSSCNEAKIVIKSIREDKEKTITVRRSGQIIVGN